MLRPLALILTLWALASTARAEDNSVEAVIVTARLRAENAQEVPASLSVVSDTLLRASRTDNVGQMIQLVPSLNYASPNPRNTSLTIRGLGSSVVAIAQSNDGLEPGVGYYVDQVYRARPAAAAFDFLDVERIEVLKGPQGTLFGKNTTAGAINITTRAPQFVFGAQTELSAGDHAYRQARAVVTGPLVGDVLAGSLSILATRREGMIRNLRTGQRVNDTDAMAIHGQLLWQPSDRFSLRLSADDASINANCCTQVFVRVGTSLKPAERQFPALAAGAGYSPPSTNPYDRVTDIDAPLDVNTDDAGYSAIATWDLGPAVLTSVTAWRWWNWDAANDRDYTGQAIQMRQHIPSRQDQYSQELRIASKGRQTLEYVAGLYGFSQIIEGQPITAYGPDAAYWLLGPAPAIPANLLDGYTQDGHTRFESRSYAAFGELTWRISDALNLTGGLRYTDETRTGRYATTVQGGLAVTGALRNSQLSILRPQSYSAKDRDGSLSGRLALAWQVNDRILAYGTLARAHKSGGINMSGLPLDAASSPALPTAVVRPETDTTYELGVKSELFEGHLVLNGAVFRSVIEDFQTNVVDTGPGALRGYLANIPEVEVRGLEVDGTYVISDHLSGRFALARTDSDYVAYRNGPCPLERIGLTTTVCDLSGRSLPNLPKLAWSVGLEYLAPSRPAGLGGEAYVRADLSGRSRVYGDPTGSRHTEIAGYGLVNARLGFRSETGWDLSVWARNLLDEGYMQNLTVQAGNSGLVVGTPGDPRTLGLTLAARF